MRKTDTFFVVFVVLLCCLSCPALAARGVDVGIVSEQRQMFPLYSIASNNYSVTTYRSYVEAVRGARYGIRVGNNTGYRIGVVIAVDGRNIISGAKSYLARNEQMYILNPNSSNTFDGWRTARDQVNRFYFTDAGDSYAGAWDDTSAMGVIAVAVFYEKVPVQMIPQIDDKAARSRDKAADARPGTGFGEGKYSPSRKVEFEAEDRPVEKHFLKYEWRETLCRRRLINCGQQRNRFWDSNDYAPYPPIR
jgi:hypothetical protein